MPVLHVENVPGELYERIERLAGGGNRTVSDEVIRLLRQAMRHEEDPQVAHAAALADLRKRRWRPPQGTPEGVELLREDRAR